MITIMKHTRMIITMTMIDINSISLVCMIVSFSCIMGIGAYVAIPKDIKDIKQILRDINHG